jgi:hypothetical protein
MTNTTRLILKTVKGIYRDGQIELTELPENINNSTQVLITFFDTG